MNFDDWFQGEQGKPYDGMYTFARAAWLAALEEAAKKAETFLCDCCYTADQVESSQDVAAAIRALKD